MAAQPGGSAFPDAATVPLADGGADDYTEEVCQAGGTARIYGIVFPCIAFVQNREIFQPQPHICKWSVSYGKKRFLSCFFGHICHSYPGFLFGKGCTR